MSHNLQAPASDAAEQSHQILLLGSTFIVAVSGLIYELVAGALSSYLIGSSVTQFSLVVGWFMFAMGVGSWASRYIQKEPLQVFVETEIAVGLTGGSSALFLFFSFTFFDYYLLSLLFITLLVGSLVGLEIPLMIRIMRERQALSSTISSVLALDYVGALFASLLFPLVLLPYLGLVRSAFLFGLVNMAVAGIALWKIKESIPNHKKLRIIEVLASVLLIIGLLSAGGLTRFAEDRLYQDEIILARDSPYQRIIVTRWREDIRLYLNGHLQFSTVDEARYHEALVHPILASNPQAKKILVLGGGDGMTARELLKYPQIERIDLVDLDPVMTELFSQQSLLRNLNKDSLNDPRLRVHNSDAGKFLEKTPMRWDVAIIDLPDPNSPSLARLYTKSFYRLLGQRIAADGALVTQATSPFYAKQAFWCIKSTMDAALPGANVQAYHIDVPSFGDWGFVIANRGQQQPAQAKLSVPTRALTSKMLAGMFVFAKDVAPQKVDINYLDRPVLVQYYEQGWRSYND